MEEDETSPRQAAGFQSRSPSVDRMTRRMAEALLGDERLRGDLEDAAYKPLLDWALSTAERCARASAADPRPEAWSEECLASLRRLLSAASRLAEGGSPDDAARLVGPPLFSPGSKALVRRQLSTLAAGASSVSRANAIVAAFSDLPLERDLPSRRATSDNATPPSGQRRSKGDGPRTQATR